MLKIKDNVDLKELEKFGFEVGITENNSKYYTCEGMYVWFFNREINDSCVSDILQVLFDLIEAGLVEKVGE